MAVAGWLWGLDSGCVAVVAWQWLLMRQWLGFSNGVDWSSIERDMVVFVRLGGCVAVAVTVAVAVWLWQCGSGGVAVTVWQWLLMRQWLGFLNGVDWSSIERDMVVFVWLGGCVVVAWQWRSGSGDVAVDVGVWLHGSGC
jgi:hypothetical protein